MSITTETRYLRADDHTINSLLAYQAKASQSAIDVFTFTIALTGASFDSRHNFDIIKRASGGGETVLGSAIAETYRAAGAAAGEQSATWACPETTLAATDAVRITMRLKNVAGGNSVTRDFITEQSQNWAGDTKTPLVAVTWTIYRYTRHIIGDPDDEGYIYHGSSTYNTRVANFQYGIVSASFKGKIISIL